MYDNIETFSAALSSREIPRILTFTNGGFLGMGASWSASYIIGGNEIHGYNTSDLGEGFKERVMPLYDLIAEKNIIEADGIIKVRDDSGNILVGFQTDSPDQEDRVQKSYDDWKNAVIDLGHEGTIVKYVKESDHVIIDATKGRIHLVTALDNVNNRTLEATLGSFNSYEFQDQKPAVDWYREVKGE